MNSERFNAYRVMWILVLFDLPTETKSEKRIAQNFRKKIMGYGFVMFQFSIYLRHCSSMENAIVHINRVQKILPEKGHIGIMSITDKQMAMMKIFHGKKPTIAMKGPQQLEIF